MTKRLVNIMRAILAGNFAKNTARPINTALLRITFAYVTALTVGHVIAGSVGKSPLPTDVPLRVMVVLVSLVGFVLCALLQLPQGQRQLLSVSGMRGVLWLLPLRRSERFVASMLPGWVTVGVLVCLGFEVVVQLASAMQLSSWVLQLSWLLGLLAGQGLSIFFVQQITRSVMMFAIIVASSMRLLQMVYVSDVSMVANYVPYIAIAVVLWPLYGFVRVAQRTSFGLLPHESKQYSAIVPEKLPVSCWMAVKVWRSSRARTSFLIVLGMSVLLAASMIIRRQIVENPYPYLIVTATLAATFCCELRGLMRRTAPPEAVTLRGMRAVLYGEFGVGLVAAWLVGLPLLLALLSSPQTSPYFVTSFMVFQGLGAFAGMIAGSLFVPLQDEVGNQFFAALLASGLVIGLPKLLAFRYETGGLPIWQCTGVLMGLGFVSMIIEAVRRKRYGGT